MRMLTLVALTGLWLAPNAAARAQTAADINRLNAAIQICNSPMGAGMAECAKLRGQLAGGGLGGAVVGSPKAAGVAAGVAGLLGAIASRPAQSAAAAPVAPPPGPGVQQAVAGCVRNAAGDTAAIQACLAVANRTVAVAAPPANVSANGQISLLGPSR